MKCVHNEDKKIRAEIESVSCSHYIMNYYGDYGFQEYLTKGAANLDEYIDFIHQRLILDQKRKGAGKGFGCAAFLARNKENDIILGRNMDCEYGIGMVTNINETNYYRSLSVTNMSELDWDDNTYDTLEQDAKYTLAAPYSPCDGINEFGLAIAILSNYGSEYPKVNTVTLLDMSIPRLILDRAKNVEEAIQLVSNYNMFYLVAPLHYMIADANGNSAVIEFVDGKMVTLRNQETYQVVTNFTLYQNPEHNGFGKERYEKIDARLQQSKGIISEEDAFDLLKKNVILGDEQYSAIYNLSKKKIQIMFAKEYDVMYQYVLDNGRK